MHMSPPQLLLFPLPKNVFLMIFLVHHLIHLFLGDGVPAAKGKDKGPTRSIASSKVQALAQIVEESQSYVTGLKDHKLPGFVHLIT